MADPPPRLNLKNKPKPNRLSLISSHSPTPHRPGDDILARLAPPTAVEALTSPTGSLKACLDGAPDADRDFAMRSALASKRIWAWVAELEAWSWPAEGGPAGFESPSLRRCRLSARATDPEAEDQYLGSLLTEDVVTYERRIGEIHGEMEELAVEDIKRHVLINHIMPLSRPSTPMTDSSRLSSSTSSSSYNKLEDLTAVITAIVVQTLPNLAKLSRLLHIWSIRVGVLRHIPPLLYAIEDAEVGLESGWAAISHPSEKASQVVQQDQPPPQPPGLKRQDFEIMKQVLANKVAEGGRMLDHMLDCLEGMHDTLPDTWLDRMERVEKDYSEWVAASERRIQEGEWAVSARAPTRTRSASPPEGHGSPSQSGGGLPAVEADDDITLSVPLEMQDREAEMHSEETGACLGTTSSCRSERSGDESPAATPEVSTGAESQGLREPSFQDPVDCPVSNQGSCLPAQSDWPDLVVEDGAAPTLQGVMDDDSEDDSPSFTGVMTPVEEEDELELPPLRERASRDSMTSQTSTVIHEASSHFDALSSDPPEVSASPGVSRHRIREAEYVDDSPPSSPPPLPKSDSRESSVELLDSPVITPIPEGEEESMFFKTPADESFVDDFDDTLSMSGVTSPAMRAESSSDQQLRQQISEIIESIPAKIKLAVEPPVVNLNPPDIQLPRLKKRPSKETLFKRSASNPSSMSSRAATPSFTLSPAKNPRLRPQRPQQEIKVYHLSRSTGEPPIKLFIRCVGEHGERVMVRVGGGWADLSEYLKEYASHHGRRSAGSEKAKVEVRDIPRASSGLGYNAASSPTSRDRPDSRAAESSPASPLRVRKTRRSVGAANGEASGLLRPKTPAGSSRSTDNAPSSEESMRSRSSSRLSWVEDDSSFLGLAGPTGKKIEMSEESRAWVESVKEKVRLASGERRASASEDRNRFGQLGKVGATKRLFRKAEDRNWR